MKRYFCSRYIKKKNLSVRANQHLADDLALFSRMRMEAFALMNGNRWEHLGRPGTIHTYLKNKYQVNDYFVTAVERQAKMTISSQSELLKIYVDDAQSDIKELKAKAKDLKSRQKFLEKMKKSIIYYTQDGCKNLKKIKNFKSSSISFKTDGTVTVGVGKHLMVYANLWLFEHKYLDYKIRQIKSAVYNVGLKLRRKEHKLTKLEKRLNEQCYSIYFGGRGLMHKDIPKAQKDKLLRKKRCGSMTLAGRFDASGGNFMVSYNPLTHVLNYRGSAGAARVAGVKPASYFDRIGEITFPYGQELVDKLISQNSTAITWTITDCGNAWKFDICVSPSEERTNNYYGDGCVAIDINWDRIALTELNGSGSLLNRKVIPFQMEGLSSDKIESNISLALEQVFLYCQAVHKPLAAEDIGSTKRKAGLYSKTSKRNRRVSLFACALMRRLIESKSLKYDTSVRFVNPTYTSQIGKIKYMLRYGLSVHESASYVIGRRGLSIIDKLQKQYYNELPVEHQQLSRITQWAKAYKFTKAISLVSIFPTIGKYAKVDLNAAIPF